MTILNHGLDFVSDNSNFSIVPMVCFSFGPEALYSHVPSYFQINLDITYENLQAIIIKVFFLWKELIIISGRLLWVLDIQDHHNPIRD